ncbi:MAG: ABC transporter permease [Oscillospiraceae bacterium]|nr:ABC transporter permease [Oscillospiraceae bacterium]
MNSLFYPKLALTNIRKNARMYLPYLFTCIFTVAMYYIMKSLSLNTGLNEMVGADVLITILELGCHVIEIFSFIFLFYTNSFLMKNRKKEFGLFNILGMEKKHLAKVIGFESLYVAVISLAGGFGAGMLLDKLMYLAVSRLIKQDIALGFYISGEAIKSTSILFSILFLLIFLNALRMISLTKPIELLKGGSLGEKEPKAKWLIALLGAGCLGTGYYLALTVENPIMALTLFFVAVILVIIGTYLLFTSGSIAFLKILKHNTRYYYQTNHFISVSGMMYRMKQNAVGLANICILSTMVLVMVSTTGSLIIGIEDVLNQHYPYQMEFNAYDIDKMTFQEIVDLVNDWAEKEDVTITESEKYSSIQFSGVYDGNDLFEVSADNDLSRIDDVCNLNFISLEDYEENTGKEFTLAENEVLLFCYGRDYNPDLDYFTLFDKQYKIVDVIDDYMTGNLMTPELCPTYGCVVNNTEIMQELKEKQQAIYGKNSSNMVSYYMVNIDGDAETQFQFYAKVWENLRPYCAEREIASHGECREQSREGIYELYGGLFFLGIFLGLLFTMATVLIIYYKQISEGLDDKNRFAIMQKVGMTEQEVKGSIRSQVLTVFFLPLIVAGIHTAIAFPIIKKIMAMLYLTNTKLFILCTAGSFLIFGVIYILIYTMTARVYYKIIKK